MLLNPEVRQRFSTQIPLDFSLFLFGNSALMVLIGESSSSDFIRCLMLKYNMPASHFVCLLLNCVCSSPELALGPVLKIATGLLLVLLLLLLLLLILTRTSLDLISNKDNNFGNNYGVCYRV
jgi:hypothetical protein